MLKREFNVGLTSKGVWRGFSFRLLFSLFPNTFQNRKPKSGFFYSQLSPPTLRHPPMTPIRRQILEVLELQYRR